MANYKELCCKTVLDVKADLREAAKQMQKESQDKANKEERDRQK